MSVTVKIEGDGINFNFTTNISKAGQIITFLGTDQSAENLSYTQPELNSTELLPTPMKSKTPRQALIESRASTNSQKIAVLGYYYCEVNNLQTFPRSELKTLFGKVGEAMPKNIHRDLKEAVLANYLYEENPKEKPDEYLITEFGKETIKKGFSIESQATRKLSRSVSKKGVVKKIISEEVKKLEIVNTLEGFPNYWSLGQKGERILWLLMFAEKNGITLLSTADVEYMASRQRDNIPTRSFMALTETIYKRGYITKSEDKYKILQPGIDFLALKVKEE